MHSETGDNRQVLGLGYVLIYNAQLSPEGHYQSGDPLYSRV